ncbi:hypothetical protein [Pedobacter nyackensis]|uniref:hypothetical protein n=1 Tax=Pedobacter nyackensis TaxID=475255 RepID=UPI00292E0661|nr:hypothetical protein [Pedobacter nyackensis]
MRILITGGKSAQAIKLANQFENDSIVLADYGDMPSFPSAKYKFLSLGERNDDIIAHNLLNHCLNEGADAILALQPFEMVELLKSAVLFNEFNIEILKAGTSEQG